MKNTKIGKCIRSFFLNQNRYEKSILPTAKDIGVDDCVILTNESNNWSFHESAIESYISKSDGFLEVGRTYIVSEISHGDYSVHVKVVGYDVWIPTAFLRPVSG